MKRASHNSLGRVAGAILLVALTAGCSASPIFDAAYLRANSNEALQSVESAEARELASPGEALKLYQQVLARVTLKEEFAEYQKTFSGALQAFQESNGYGSFTKDSSLGIPEVYARQVMAMARAHQGLARIYLMQNELGKAEAEATDAVALIRRCEFCPHTHARSLRESNRILQNVYQAQGAVGKAMIRKLNADLLEDHLATDGGLADFFSEKRVLYGERSQQQFAAVEKLFQGAMQYQSQQELAMASAIAGGIMAANAGIQQGLAQRALAKSGGVMTPQVQAAQLNAQMAQMQSQLFMTMVAAQAGSNPKTLQVNTTPWAIPTFTQQLVDPKQGADTPTIMKGFAANAAQAGGASYHAGAQDVTQAVDELVPYRQSGKVDGAAAQVEKFAEVFNAFLTQVQEIRK
ncbi:MAG: hypothetical protein AABY61_16010 [Nitrospirota bacterium]